MKFTVKNNDLLQIISKTMGVIPTRSTIPELEYLLFSLSENKLTATGTDTEVTIISKIVVKGERDGSVLIPTKRVFETLKNQPGKEITFIVEDEKSKIKISTDTGTFHPGGIESNKFPETPALKSPENFNISGKTFQEIISTTIFAVSHDDLRPSMTGVCFELQDATLNIVSTDGHRLVKQTLVLKPATKINRTFIIPTKALTQIEKSLSDDDVQINLTDEYASFILKNATIITRLITEKYPNYNTVIPTDNNSKLIVEKSALLQATKIVAIYSNTISHQVRFALKENQIKIAAEDVDFGSDANETVSCEYNDDEMEIGFNANYIVDALTHLNGDSVVFKLSTATRAIIIEPAEKDKDKETMMLVMPVRLNN